ncbi:MAG: hypothetical protein AB8B87_13125 [Granulosicoccus sp.]
MQPVWLLVLLAAFPAIVWSATPAGTLIRNQASASYLDANGRSVTVTSNLVETRIEQVAGLELVSDQQQRTVAGGNVRFTHRIKNTGNGTDQFDLSLINVGGDNFDISGLGIYSDNDRNGIPDNQTPISSTTQMAADAEYYVVIEGSVPGTVGSGDSALLEITASSNFDVSQDQTNTDTILVDDGATLRLTKSISRTRGDSPDGPFTVYLQYENTGVDTATDVTIIDALPSGMSYVPGSGQWSESGASLSDANTSDIHAGSVSNARYCAYDASCTGIAEAQLDADSSSTNQVTLIVDNLVAGDTGTLSFQVNIDADLSSGELVNQAEFELTSNGSLSARAFSNPVGFTVLPRAGVVANGSDTIDIDGTTEPVTIVSGAQGGAVLFDNIIWNTGNQTDTFNIELQTTTSTMPTDSSYQLLRSDNATPLQDTNNDGITDTGPILPGQFARVVLRVDLPAESSGNNGGAGFSITKTARSVSDSNVFNAVTDHLDQIVANQVDLTNQAPAGDTDALGSGPGPETLPVSTLSSSAGGKALVDLYIRHQGVESDSYALRAYGSAGGADLPEGWTVRFLDPSTNAILTDTGPLASGASRHIVAELSVPENATAGTTSLYFEALSERTGASDIKHDAVSIGVNTDLNLEPSLSAQLEPGGSVLYSHTLTNIGNTVVSDIDLQLSHSLPGWTGTLFADSNANGVLDDSDPIFTGTVSLAAGEFLDLFVKVFAPANALVPDQNVSTVQASWNSGASTLQITDTTTVTETHVSIVKEQAIDMGCDGTPDPSTTFTRARFAVPPGNNCVIYRLIATNTGLENSYNVRISDKTPSFTRYRPTAFCSRSPCWIIEPGFEGTGPISAETDQLAPGASFHLTFSVRIE